MNWEADKENEPVDFGAMNQTTLEKIRFGISQAMIDPNLLIDANVDLHFDRMKRQIVANFEGYLYGEKLKGKIIKHPRDWWQAFKERWFPVWALDRWPVEYTVHTVTFDVVYPDFKPSLPRRHSDYVVMANYDNNN